MKYLFVILLLLFILFPSEGNCEVLTDDVQTLKTLLKDLKSNSTDDVFALHFQSIIDVIDAKGTLSSADSILIKGMLSAFTYGAVANASDITSYLDRSRYLVIAWISPTDGEVSFFNLRLPKDWNKKETYPLYVDLHGLTSKANNPIDFLTYNYRFLPDQTIAFEDGYQIAPLARGNLWYQGISETDIWEAIDVIESLVNIDQTRKYLVGHSMGGYGTWSIASKSPEVWAAIGIEAGALWYGNNMLTADKIQRLSTVPTYFVVGTSDGLYDINLQAYNLLVQAGNTNTAFVTFNGGHEKLTPNVENMYLWLREFVNDGYTDVKKMDKAEISRFRIFPNPVRTETTIRCKLERPGLVQMELFDISGKKVTTIINRELNSGETIIRWSRGELRSGIYTYTLKVGQHKEYGKLVLF
ncbi:MAG TPA: alpha/beta hydrolase-fold protein [Prolixibacteraceae bacterium]|nr:alpha/beta hydrolase-fold protein [Prolixibacteraceae bacterium]HPS12167.1 alpha/beta hydrolase-fold protein [Prolixibacteraceae bacterium]